MLSPAYPKKLQSLAPGRLREQLYLYRAREDRLNNKLWEARVTGGMNLGWAALLLVSLAGGPVAAATAFGLFYVSTIARESWNSKNSWSAKLRGDAIEGELSRRGERLNIEGEPSRNWKYSGGVKIFNGIARRAAPKETIVTAAAAKPAPGPARAA